MSRQYLWALTTPLTVTGPAGTTGASTGIIPDTGLHSKILFMILMYVGRLGPVALALALAPENDTEVYRFAQESVKIG